MGKYIFIDAIDFCLFGVCVVLTFWVESFCGASSVPELASRLVLKIANAGHHGAEECRERKGAVE